MVRLTLLDELDAAIGATENLVARGELTPFDLESWPALDDLRSHTRWQALRTAARDRSSPAPLS